MFNRLFWILGTGFLLLNSALASEKTTVYFYDAKADFEKNFPHFDLSEVSETARLREAIATEMKAPETTSKMAKNLKIMLTLLDQDGGLEISQGMERENRIRLLVELGWSVASNLMVPVPKSLHLQTLAWQYIFGGDLIAPPVCQGTVLSGSDRTLAEPVQPSTFWTKPADIASRDTYFGFGRTEIPRIEDQICEYKRKTDAGYGTHAKIYADCGPYKGLKIKFGKVSSDAFGTRMYSLMGYNTSVADHADFARVKFTPEIFDHFNDRKDAVETVIPGLIKVHTQNQWDPFAYIYQVEMKDGSVYGDNQKEGHKLADLKQKLFVVNKKVKGLVPALIKNNLTAFQSEIENIVFGEVDIELDGDKNADGHDWKKVGGWDWSGQGHRELPELRMIGIFAAWLNALDTRWDNNELMVSKSKSKEGEKFEIQHVIKDLGGVLGGIKNLRSLLNSREQIVRVTAEDPNDFPWEFTKAEPIIEGNPRKVPLNGNFHTIQLNGAIEDSNIDNALYMANLMKEIQPEQVKAALIGSGFASAKVRMFMNKLANRRNLMFQHLGLTEVKPWPLEDADQHFSYDPLGEIAEGQPESVIVNGQTIFADDNDGVNKNVYKWVVYSGKVMTRAEAKKRIH